MPHRHTDDPRVMWSIDLCGQVAPSDVLAVETVPSDEPARTYDGRVYIETVPQMEYVSARAQRAFERWSGLWYGDLVAAYTSREGRPAPASGRLGGLRSRWRQQLAAAQRMIANLASYNLLASALLERGLGVSVAPTLIVSHDIYALVAAVRLKRRFRCKVLYDSHEYWSDADLLAQPWQRHVMAWIERRFIRQADAVVTVSPQLARRLERLHRIRGVLAVPNARPVGAARARPRRRSLPDREVAFLFHGHLSPGRGIEAVLVEWERLEGVPATLYLRCYESEYLERLRDLHPRLFEAGRVRVLPTVPDGQLIAATEFADVGIIPYPPSTTNHMYACPNKLAEYLQAGLAVLTNDLEFVRNLVDEHDCGLAYDSGIPDSFVEAVRELVSDPKRLGRMKENAWRLGRGQFNWEAQSGPYREAVSRLAVGGRA